MADFAEPSVPPIVLDSSFSVGSPLTLRSSPFSPLTIGGPAFSYMVATLILAMLLLGAWAYKVSHYRLLVESPPGQRSAPSAPEMQFVGRITGMKDCRWSDPGTQTYLGSSVPLGRRYALSAGLMEITYESGAKVILEGPCNYVVESDAGGFLALGRLTARVEKREEGREKSAKPQAANHRISKSPNPQIINQQS